MNLRDEQFHQTLKNMVSGDVLFDEPTERHTSIGVGGRADAIVFPGSIAELQQIISFLGSSGINFIPVGNWTNVIVRDGGYRGVFISLQCFKSITRTERNGGYISLNAEAGVALSDLVRMSADDSLTGMEFCAGIPGSVGGGVKMNAGAYGSEMKDIVETISVLNMDGEISDLKRQALKFEYRKLELPQGAIIVSASFLLMKGVKEKIRERIRGIVEMRRGKHPLEHRNAGSIFKNPQDIPAGRIIDEIGLKGIKIGGAKISEKHGNFIVNTGDATAKDILTLIDIIRKRVWEEKGIHLETEVRIVGEDG